MEGFRASFVNEIEKLVKRKKAVVVVILSLLVIILGQLMVVGIRSGFGLRMTSSSEFPLLVLTVLANTVLPLFGGLVVIDMFTGEFSHNTMKLLLTRPVARFKLYSAKIAAAAFFVLANLLLVMVLSIITGLLFNNSPLTAAGFGKILLSYFITLLPVMVLVLLVTVLANLFRSGTGVFFISIFLYLVMKALGYIFSRYSSLFVTSMLDWYNLWIADSIPFMKVLRLFLIMLGGAVMAFTAGYYLFDRKEL